MWPFLPQNPCGCSSNESTTNVGSDNIRYAGPVLACTGIEPCDTLTTALQKIDNVVCGILDTLDVCCTTTTSTTTICPCTTYGYVGPRFNPGTITYVQCNTLEPITDTASSTVQFACVDNNYPIIEVGSINVIDTQDCCSNITTTTTTTIAINSFCYEVTTVGKCTIYWTDANGDAQSQIVTNNTINICADEDSIASNCEAIGITGGTVACTNNAICQPTTTTTTTIACNCVTFNNTDESVIDHTIGYNDCIGEFVETTISASEVLQFCGSGGIADSELVIVTTGGACIEEVCPTTTTTTTVTPLACVSYLLQSTSNRDGASNVWQAFACNSNIEVGGTIPFPGTMETGCITEGSLLLGASLEVVSDAPCEGVSCEAFLVQGNLSGGDGSWEAIDCLGNPVGGIAPTGNTLPTGCIIPQTLILDNAYIKQELGPCGSTTTTTTTRVPTTTTTTTPVPTFFKYNLSTNSASTTIACDKVTFPIEVYSDDPTLNLGSFLYTDMALTIPFAGAARWYKESGSGKVFAILNSGEIAGESNCTPTTTTTSTTLFPPTTTTTTTVVNFSHGLSAGKASNVLACAETVAAITVYTSTPTIAFGTFLYTNPALTIPFNGGGAAVYYKVISTTNWLRNGTNGQIFSFGSC